MTSSASALVRLKRLGRRASHVGFTALIALALAAATTGCRSEAQDRNFDYDNPIDPNQDTGTGGGDNTGQLVIALVQTVNDIVVIVNTGTEDTDMSGWTLVNEDATASYAFSGLTLGTAEFFRVFTGTGTDTTTDLFTGTAAPNWGSTFPNTQAILRNSGGTAIDICESGEPCWQ